MAAFQFAPRRRQLALISLILFIIILLLWHKQSPDSRLGSLAPWRVLKSDACKGWSPADTSDPPGCLRARQYRQLERLWGDMRYDYGEEVTANLKRLESCLNGTLACPETPLVLSTWWFTYAALRGGVAGEEIWMREVADAVEAEGYILIADFRMARMLHLSRMLSESVNMVWMNENNVVECTSNPRCIAPEDYRPAAEGQHRHNLNTIPSDGLGAIPLWKLFCVTFWGSRPSNADRPGGQMHRDWGIPVKGGDEVWSFHPLGRAWQLTPYPYPGHTWIPLSIERKCASTPVVPWGERNASNLVMIMGKRASFFNTYYGQIMDYAKVVTALRDANVTATLVSTLEIDTDVDKSTTAETVPAQFTNYGKLPRTEYAALVSQLRAMVGMGTPVISPSPYVALCRGTPVIMPYMRDDVRVPSGWTMYSGSFFQHGPISALPEPYVYSYKLGDAEDLAAQIAKAVRTPIEPYIPKGYTAKDQAKAVKDLLHADHKARYARIVRANGGRVPNVPSYMLDKCWDRGLCYFEPHEDDYIGD